MEKDDIDIRSLREWQPLDDVLHQIPASIRRGLFLHDLNVTCCDVVAEFLALGTDAGVIFWYDRMNGHTQKLRAESAWPITCIKVVSTVEYMVAVGNTHGEITIFQIQKQLPGDLLPHELAASLIASPIRPNERYTIRNVGRGRITCVEWSKNGSKLFSGDANGVVLFTEFDFGQHICKSMEILNEKYGIVQMSFRTPWLLVSSLYRAIVCQRNDRTNEWRISQIGRSDRKTLSEFGATFEPADTEDRSRGSTPPGIICSRPRFRFWMADVEGNVSHTYLLKDSVAKNSTIFEVPLLNPRQSRPLNLDDVFFGPCHPFLGKFLITYCESIVFVVNLEVLKVIATIRRLRRIQYLAVHGDEIFIVEGGRSVVRVAMRPEPAVSPNGFQYVPANSDNLLTGDAKIEIVEECVAQGDECFELPPIEHIRLDVPLMCNFTEHNLLRDDKLLLEHSRKLEAFEKLNELDYDDSILFAASTKRKKKLSADNAAVVDKFNGIVEIGQQAELFDKRASVSRASSVASGDLTVAPTGGLHVERIVRPAVMEASFCNGSGTLEARMERANGGDDAPVIERPPARQPKSTPPTDITAIAFRPIDFSYPVDVNPITNATPTKVVDVKTKQMPKPDAPDDTQNIDKFPGLANMPKLWDISIECDEHRQTNGNGDGSSADKANAPNDGIDDDWVFL